MLKKITYILSAVMLCSCVLLVPSFESKAATVQFDTRYSKPLADDFCGYIEINTYSASRDHNLCYVIMWTMSDAANNSMMMNIKLNASNINFIATGGADWVTISSMSLDGMSYPNVVHNGLISSAGYTFTFWSDYKAVAYHVYGNYGSIATSMGVDYYGDSFTVLYGSEILLHNQINDIVAQLKTANANDTQILAKLNEILSSNKTLETKLSELIELQEESNSWLEKIFNYLNESQEKQKQEAQTQGNNSTSQGMDAIEDKGGDFAGSLSGLTNSMSYTGTQCAWEFPQVKLPAISGVMGEIILIEKQPIDFAVWVNAIPSDILLVVQSLCTAGLIIYCFKELYDTIAYVLTLRKDDNS